MINIQSDEDRVHTILLERILSTLSAHKYLILAIFLGVFAGVYGSLQLMTEQYQITASVLVKLGRENMETQATVSQGNILATGVRPEDINSEIQLISSPALIARTVETMGPDAFKSHEQRPVGFLKTAKFYLKKAVRWVKGEYEKALILLNLKKELTEQQKLISDIGSRLVVERQKDSDVIAINIRMPDPDLAIRLLDTLLALYLEKHAEVHRNRNIREFFEREVSAYSNKLAELDRQHDEVRKHWNLIAAGEQKALLLKRLHALYEEIDSLRTEKRLLGYTGEADCVPENRDGDLLSNDKALTVLREKIATLKSEKIRLLELYDKNTQAITNVDRNLQCLLSVVANSVNGRLRQMEERASAIEKELRALNEGENKLEAIERERIFSKENYLSYMKRREDARVSEELDLRRVSNVTLLNAPTSSLQPVYPKKMLIMALSVPLGLVLGLCMALALDYFSGVIRTPYDLSDIKGIDFLGTFSYKSGKG